MRLRCALLYAAALTGCSFQAHYDDTSYLCGAGDTCPSGQACVAGRCIATGAGDAAGGGDGAVDGGPTPDAAVGADVCGSLSLLRDDFADGVAAPFWDPFASGAATTVETGGHLAVQVPAGTLADGAGYTSTYAYDFTGAQLSATVSQVGGVITLVEVSSPGGARVQMFVEAGILYAGVDGVADPGTRAQLAYDPAVHAHWRLREAQGDTYWEWSTDGVAWHELWHEADPLPLDHVTARLEASGELQAASEARFEDVNLDATPALGYCPTASLADDFVGGSLAPTWLGWNDGPCTVAETGGKLVLTFPGTGDVYCGADTHHLYDAVGSTIYVDAAGAPDASSFVTFFQLVPPGDGATRIEFDREATAMELQVYAANALVQQKTITYDATAHRFWRFRIDASTVHWETSPDGATWTGRYSTAPPFDLSAVHVVLGAGTYAPGPGSQTTCSYGSVNLP